MLVKMLASQLADPRGFLGRAVAGFMNRSNAAMNQRAITLLGTRRGDRVLEIGFGGGSCLGPLLAQVRDGEVWGLDASATMVSGARRRYAETVQNQRLRLAHGTVEELPYPSGLFDRVLTVNTIYFWSALDGSLGEILRVLKPGGTLVLGYRPIESMQRLPVARHGFRLMSDEVLLKALGDAGFEVVALEMADDDGLGYACAVAVAPGA